MKTIIKNLLENPETSHGRIFAITIQFLIVVSLVTFSIDTLPDLSTNVVAVLQIIEIVTVIIFTCEYLLRLVVADNRIGFIFSFYGIIDLIAILPFYIASGIDLRTVRIFRLFRILKIFRYSKTINRFHRALLIAKDELIVFSFVALIFLYLAAVGIYYFEHETQPEQFKSIFHSLWWAVVTLTTVGYGDIYPITVGGRIFTFFVLIIGLGVVAVPTGIVASALSQAHNKEPPVHKHNVDILMQAVKQEALNTIARLPEDADMEEIMYRLYVLKNIRRGQRDAAQGKTLSAEEALRDIQIW